MSEVPYGYDCLRLRAAREERGLTVAEIARASGLSGRAVSFYLSGERHPRAEILPRLAGAVGLADPLDLCNLGSGERVVHLRFRVGKSRTTVAAALGWHKETYREWETSGRAKDKMSGLRDAWKPDPGRPGWGRWTSTPFFTVPMVRRGATVNGAWQPPVYGPREYGNPEHEDVFEVPAERLYQALQRTRGDSDAERARWLRDNPDLAADIIQASHDQLA
ncbi:MULTISPECIES: helix-turn-helix domain-containing protein [Streptomyces]|uniref:helix-turn-helix domain-containing protein n=1 Tax=Streptomyces TaxID=1883 RepID=UPI0033D3CEAB